MRKVFLLTTALLLVWSCSKDDFEKNQVDNKDTNPEFFRQTKNASANGEFTIYILDCLRHADDSIAFTGNFVESFGLPQWSVALEFERDDYNSLIVPIYDKGYKSISGLYYLHYQNKYIQSYVLLNDEDDVAYPYSKRMIQYFEKILGLETSNKDFDIEIETQNTSNDRTKSNMAVDYEICYSWWQVVKMEDYEHWSRERECHIETEFIFDTHHSSGGWANHSGGNYSANSPYGGGNSSGSDGPKDPEPYPGYPNPPIETSDSFLKNEKLECIWSKINNIAVNHNNSLITSIFANFSGVAYNPQDISITVQDNLKNKDNEEIYGSCLPVGNNFLITLNGSYIDNRAPIEIFKTIIHEMLHAHLKRMYGASPDTFKSLFYKHIKSTKGVTLSEHDIMKQYYIPVMINALKSFDNLNGYSDDDYVYEGIAINGLDKIQTDEVKQHVFFSENYFRSRNLNCEE